MSSLQKPKTDAGTILTHWVIAGSLLGAAITGLAIASGDNPDLWAVRFFGFLLPGENLWYTHLFFAVLLIAALAAYALYIRKAKLGDRVRLSAARFKALLLPG